MQNIAAHPPFHHGGQARHRRTGIPPLFRKEKRDQGGELADKHATARKPANGGQAEMTMKAIIFVTPYKTMSNFTITNYFGQQRLTLDLFLFPDTVVLAPLFSAINFLQSLCRVRETISPYL